MPETQHQRVVNLAYAGHSVDEIANAMGLSANAVRGVLQDLTVAPTVSASGPKGATGATGAKGVTGARGPTGP